MSWIVSQQLLLEVIARLIEASVWFEITPLSDNDYDLTVKSDVVHVVNGILQMATA